MNYMKNEKEITPSLVYSDEILNWDATIEVAPRRPSGMLSVTLEYGGRGTPTPIENWKEDK